MDTPEVNQEFSKPLIGEVVSLKSGGPQMTVESNVPGLDKTVSCVWMDSAGLLHRDRLKVATLDFGPSVI